MNSDDESGSSREADYDPLTAMFVYTEQDRPILPPPGPQDLCTIINPSIASTSPTVAKTTLNKKRVKKKKTGGERPGPKQLKKKKHPVKAIFRMGTMFGGDDTFIPPKTFQLFDKILE